MKASLFYYYIAKRRVRGRNGNWVEQDVFPNPSPILQRIGVRVDGSVWVIPTHLLPFHLMEEMDNTVGVDRNDVPFADAAAENLIDKARKYLNKVSLEAVNAVQDAANLEYDPEEWDDKGGRNAFEAHKASRINAIARQKEKDLADYKNAAAGFGIALEDLDLDGRHGHIRTIRLMSRNRAKVYVEAAKRLRKAGQAALADAADSDQLPPYMLADLLRDNGDDETADEIQEAFSV